MARWGAREGLEAWERPVAQEVLEGPRGPGKVHGVREGPRGVLKCQRRSKKLQEDAPHRTPMSATIGLLSKVMLRPPSLIYHSSGWEFGITKYQIFMEVGTLFLHLISGGHVAWQSTMVTHKLWLCSIGER